MKTPIYFDFAATTPVDPDLVFTVGGDGVRRSTDFGLTWTATSMPGDWIGTRPFDRVEISKANPQVVWASSRLIEDPLGNTGGIYVSSDGGLSFEDISDKFPETVTEASGIATHPLDGNTAYFLFSAAGTPKVLKTTDLGNTWEDLSLFEPGARVSENGFPDVAVFDLLVMPYNTDILWAATEIGLFISEDAGQSWQVADNGLPNVGIFEIKIEDEQVVVATYGRGIWTVDLPELEGYQPPEVTLAPRIESIGMSPLGMAVANINLRSVYDAATILINEEVYQELGGNAESETISIDIEVLTQQDVEVQVIGYKDDVSYPSPIKSAAMVPRCQPS